MSSIQPALRGKRAAFSPTNGDSGSGAHDDLGIAETVPSSSDDPAKPWYLVADYAKAGGGSCSGELGLMIQPLDDYSSDAIARPVGFSRKWGMSKNANNMGIWTPNAPPGYVALGDLWGYDSQSFYGRFYACVRQDLCVQVPLESSAAWTDQGSGAHDDGSVWRFATGLPGLSSQWLPYRGFSDYNGHVGETAWFIHPDAIVWEA
jgi:hypothetical protein